MSAAATAAKRHAVGRLEDFPLNVFRIVDVGGRQIGVVRTERGFFACQNRCPHQGAEICRGLISGTMAPSAPQEFAYSSDRVVVTCPWHRWEFDLETGRSVEDVTNRKLVVYPVEVKDGLVHLTVSADGAKEAS